MKETKMSIDDAKTILFDSKMENKSIWKKYETPYDTAVKTLKSSPEHAHLLKENYLGGFSTVLSAITEAGKIGLDRSARMEADKEHRRMIIAERLKVVRQTHKMTQEEISEAIDWNTLTYRGYENCKSDVPIVILIRLADHYNVSLDYLTGRTEDFHDKSDSGAEIEQRIANLENMVKNLSGK